MYMIFENREDAETRNKFEAFKRGCQPPTVYWWRMIHLSDGRVALCVENGDGLSDAETLQCVESIHGAYYRRTGETDENGNYYLEYSPEVTLSDGTVINESNKDIYDGVEGWHWYDNGEVVSIATPSMWEKIKGWFGA